MERKHPSDKNTSHNFQALEEVQEIALTTENATEFKQFKRKMRHKSRLNLNKELEDVKNRIFKEKVLVKDLWDKEMKIEVRTLYNYKASNQMWQKLKHEGQEHEIQKKRKSMLIKEQIEKIKKKQDILEDFLARNKIDTDILHVGETHHKDTDRKNLPTTFIQKLTFQTAKTLTKSI